MTKNGISTTTFLDWWKTLGPEEKDRVTVELADECIVSLTTVQAWGRGYRIPRPRAQSAIVAYLLKSGLLVEPKTLFPKS